MAKQTFTRQELYDLVWSEPMLSLSKKYNISDVGLRKTCIRMSIPMPKAGHWQKLKFGKKIKKVPLPDNYLGEQEVSFSLRDEKTPFPVRGESPLSVLKHQIENDSSLKLTVPDKLTNPDKLIIAARESLNRKDSYAHHGLISCHRGELDIRVTKENIPRALRFMDVFIKAMRTRGHEITIENDSTYAVVKTQKLEISLREKTKRIPGTERWQTSDYQPTGQLVFKLDETFYDREWMDAKLPLEDQLPTILAKLELISIELNERDLVWQKHREERELQEKLRKAYEEKQQKDLTDFKDMLLKAARWHKAVNLRNYIDTVEQNAINSGSLSEELQEWLTWARKKADWYDPFIELKDELLNEVDRETLTYQ
jgi:hypothetical protein